MAVCKYKYKHLINLIVTQQTGETPLHCAARSGNAEAVNALLKAGSKVDEKDPVSMFWKYEIEFCILHAFPREYAYQTEGLAENNIGVVYIHQWWT